MAANLVSVKAHNESFKRMNATLHADNERKKAQIAGLMLKKEGGGVKKEEGKGAVFSKTVSPEMAPKVEAKEEGGVGGRI